MTDSRTKEIGVELHLGKSERSRYTTTTIGERLQLTTIQDNEIITYCDVAMTVCYNNTVK